MKFYRNVRRTKTGQESKFGNTHSTSPCAYGFSHRSQLELSVCHSIFLREKAGEIKHVQHEDHLIICGPPGHDCPRKITYVADFKNVDLKTGQPFWVEAKGFANDRWPMKKNLYKHFGPGPLEIWGGHYKNPTLIETIIPILRAA